MINKILKYFNTIKYLKIKQIFYRLFYLFRNKYRQIISHKYDFNILITKESTDIKLLKIPPNNHSFENNTFTFINLSKNFSDIWSCPKSCKNHSFVIPTKAGIQHLSHCSKKPDSSLRRNDTFLDSSLIRGFSSVEINWNFLAYGKLWTYNLNYFDFLNQEKIDVKEGISLIENFIAGIEKNNIGLEPFPISLRCINWIKFLSKNSIKNKNINVYIYIQYKILLDNLEYHILGNHLLENGFSLLFGAYYFNDLVLYIKAKQILQEELNEQILDDGGHFELSPMYHEIILFRVLDCINLVENSKLFKQELLIFLKEKASKMLSWLNLITYENGNIPLFNDSANVIALTTAELNRYGAELGIKINSNQKLGKSGYRKIKNQNYEMIVDVGNIGPDYIPGHAHSDIFNFELYVKNQPIIIDTGTSTYEENEIRQSERSTSAHNTVQVENFEQTEIWSSFRVGKRAYVKELEETNNKISAVHTGYEKIGAKHKREFDFFDKKIIIMDNVISTENYLCFSYLHFYPNVKIEIKGKTLLADNMKINFENVEDIEIKDYYYSSEFNKRILSKMIVCKFYKNMKMEIIL